MNLCNRRINYFILFTLCFLFLPAFSIQAEEGDKNAGELEIKVNRITDDSANQSNTETELDKTFPDLFEEETTEIIKQTQEQKEQDIEKLRKQLFSGGVNEYSILQETKDLLFTPEYTASEAASGDQPEDDQYSMANQLLVAGLVSLVIAALGGCFALVRKLAD